MLTLSNAEVELLISYFSRDQYLPQDLQDLQARLHIAHRPESDNDHFGLLTPQPIGAFYGVSS